MPGAEDGSLLKSHRWSCAAWHYRPPILRDGDKQKTSGQAVVVTTSCALSLLLLSLYEIPLSSNRLSHRRAWRLSLFAASGPSSSRVTRSPRTRGWRPGRPSLSASTTPTSRVMDHFLTRLGGRWPSKRPRMSSPMTVKNCDVRFRCYPFPLCGSLTLNPCPEPPLAIRSEGYWGAKSMTKLPSGVSEYQHIRV